MTDCINDFKSAEAVSTLGPSKKAAQDALKAAIKAYLNKAQAELKCGSMTCSGGECSFDYGIEPAAPRKVIVKTTAHGKKRRWIASATVLVGCFCPGDSNDDDDD